MISFELIPLPDKKATTVTRELFGIFTKFSGPDVIIDLSNRGTELCNAVSEVIFTHAGVEDKVSSPYYSQTSSYFFVKRNIRDLKNILEIFHKQRHCINFTEN